MAKTYKAEIALEMISKFPSASTNAIARLLHEQYPVDFPSKDSARTMVRKYRDGLGGKNEPVRTKEERKQAMSKWNLPESDYKEI